MLTTRGHYPAQACYQGVLEMWGTSCSSLYIVLATGGGGCVPFIPHCYFQIPHSSLNPLAWEPGPSAYSLPRPLNFISSSFLPGLFSLSPVPLWATSLWLHIEVNDLYNTLSFSDLLFSRDHPSHPYIQSFLRPSLTLYYQYQELPAHELEFSD